MRSHNDFRDACQLKIFMDLMRGLVQKQLQEKREVDKKLTEIVEHQFLSGMIKYTITVAICSLAALFVMHTCGQLEILMALTDNMVNEMEEKQLDRKLALIVEHQIRMRNLLGIWPETEPTFLKKFSLILGCYFILACELIPTILYIVLIEKRLNVRMKLVSSIMFTILAVLKYSSLVLSKNQVRNCLTHVKDDWQNVSTTSARNSMIDKARTARRLLILCGISMYTTGLYYRTVVPLSRGKSVNDQNVTIRHLPNPSYFVLFNGQISPAYEIVFFIQFLAGMIKYTITVAICSLAALFVMHTCGQLEILKALTNNMVNEMEEKQLDKKLALIVEHQIRIRNFIRLAQSTLENTSLFEVMGCTIILCFVGHLFITDWATQDVIYMFSYLTFLLTITFNIYIFCFIGEQLSVERERLALTVCTLDWYRFPNAKARSLVLVIAMSIVPTKIKAGKFFDLTIRTFGDVVKTAVTYMNFIRKVME
ncbi:odorant receptor 4-like [Temnothorax longispinosus]|uniref:odorant receptor 4-like n=1 Tax=Temnothorax longispinosus TaxID=300112 RepID=UPI003A9A0EE7